MTQPAGLQSKPYKLKSDNIVVSLWFISSTYHHPHRSQEFGIDIVDKDNKTIIHHKVAAHVVYVFAEQDALVASRVAQHQ
jgi:hypothetical protein